LPGYSHETVRGIRLPRTSGRTAVNSFAKLLNYVDPEASTGFGFEGKIFRPGATVTEAELWAEGYPETPILLEYAAPGPIYGRGHNRAEQLYVLWKFDREEHAWVELGRARSVAWEWALDLRPIALRALAAARSGITVLPNLGVIAARISGFLDGELKPLEVPDREKVLAVIHDQFAGLMARGLLSHGP
jgi:hypothetical protein